MSNEKRPEIRMDHSQAHLMEFTRAAMASKSISPAFNCIAEDDARCKSEHLRYNKEQQTQKAYFIKPEEAISLYEEAIRSGPTDAIRTLKEFKKRSALCKN